MERQPKRRGAVKMLLSTKERRGLANSRELASSLNRTFKTGALWAEKFNPFAGMKVQAPDGGA